MVNKWKNTEWRTERQTHKEYKRILREMVREPTILNTLQVLGIKAIVDHTKIQIRK